MTFLKKTVNQMKNFKLLTLSLALALSVGLSSTVMAQDFAIIVNSANSAAADDSEIKNLFLKKKTTWSSGAEAVPFARPADTPEHKAFIQNFLDFSQADLDNYWQAEKSKSGLTGPREVGSTNILTRQVSRKEGAFGIISASDAGSLPDGVKVLKKF